ncbi:cytochrome P450 [Chlorella sorokiniana]|uniref:Cytochrome P450 n=1 Tax=Chlorella sorokiniana TaxID=3076 RepID=A0A2P6U0B8_CHLSO|nr:cytochrome P450 [Chlorella sorokiniana]|eukprot:PRW59761.1 cytochrome P450 [Chlorella sorokiniana]
MQCRSQARRRAVVQPRALLSFFRGGSPKSQQDGSSKAQQAAVDRLLSSIEPCQRGLSATQEQQAAVLDAVAALGDLGSGSTTTDADKLSATWKLLWTTEKETLWILKNAGLFGTAAGDVFQVVDVEGGLLQNVITFPPEGAFIVDSAISTAGPQRTQFQFNAATVKLPAGRKLPLPPFGKGWFDTIYVDDRIRVAQDSRGDMLVVARDGPPRRMNSTAEGEWLAVEALSALPAQLTSLPAALMAAICLSIGCLWLLSSGADDFAKLPGPPSESWLLGCLKQVNQPTVHRFFQSNTQKYGAGGLWAFRLAHMRVVVLSSPETVQAVVSRSSDLPKATVVYDAVDELFSPVGQRSFFTTHDPEAWRVVRKGTAPAFSLDNIRKAFPRLLEITNTICGVLAVRCAAGGGACEVEVSETAMRITLDLIGTTGYGYDFKAREYGPCEMFEIVPPLLAEFTLRGTNPMRGLTHRLLPFLPDARTYTRSVKVCHRWWNVLLKNVRATDLAAAEAAGDTSLRTCLAKLPLTDDQLVPQIAVYLIAGFETTAHSIAWALYEIAANPAVQDKLEAELAAAGLLGPEARPLEFADLNALTYLNAVLKEAMRLHPVASVGSVRRADRWVELNGHRLAPGTLFWVPFIGILTSQHNWERAEEFWPERWEQAPGPAGQPSPAGPPKSYLPFSDGPRDCIGQNLALMEARGALALLAGRFRLSVAPRMGNRQAVREAEVMKLTLQCKSGIWLRLEPRNQPAAVAALICVCLSCLWLAKSSLEADDWHKLPGPPSTFSSVIVSSAGEARAHIFFQDNTQLYGAGGLWGFRLAHLRVVVLSSPEAVQAVVSRGNDLPKAAVLYDGIDTLFSPKGIRSFFNTHNYDEWKLMRKGTAPAFSLDNIRKAFPRLLEITDTVCDVLAARCTAGGGACEAEVSETAMRITLDLIGMTGYGYDFKALLAEFTLRGVNPKRRLLHALLPFLPEARTYARSVKACHRWWEELLRHIRATNLEAAEAAGDTSLRTCLAKLPVADDLLLPQIALYVIAGFETTAHSIAWALYEIAANPAVQDKLEAELAAAGLLGPEARPLEFADLNALSYLNAVLKEAMRLHPVASTGTVRRADRWVELNGHRLAPGTLFWAPFIGMLTSRHNFTRPEEFWPERWEHAPGPAGQPSPAGPPKSYLPFSDGPRDCIGQNLALMEARGALALLAGRFRLSVAPRMGDRQAVREAEVMKLTLQVKSGIWLRLEPRA